MPSSVIFLTVIATLFPIAYYLYVGFRSDSRPRDLDDYFIYSRKVSAKDFANTSVGYALQVAAVFLFADWGIRYGFGAFWVPVFWGLGFLLLYLLLPWFDRFLAGKWTLHGYLYGVSKSRGLQTVAAIATIIGLWGTMMVEIDYATSVYAPFFVAETTLYVLGILFLTFAFLYIAFGGYKAEVNTERVQVPVAYAAFLLVLLLLLLNVLLRGYWETFISLALILLILFALMIAAKVRIVPGRPLADWQVWIPIGGLALVLGIALSVGFGVPHGTSSSPQLPSLFAGLGKQLAAQGVLPLLSLLLANALWQFVDISNWQRLASLELPATTASATTERYDPLRRGLWRVMIESPVSWGFGVVFGMSLHYSGFLRSGEDPSAALTNFATALTSGQQAIAFLGPYSSLVYVVFVAAIVAIMLSTVSALLSAITFTTFHDLPPFARGASLQKARWYTLGVAAIGAVAYYVLRHVFGVGIQATLYTFYSSQLALFPTVLTALRSKRVDPVAALVSLLVGIPTTFVASVFITPISPDLAVIPPLVALLSSGILYAIVASLRRSRGG